MWIIIPGNTAFINHEVIAAVELWLLHKVYTMNWKYANTAMISSVLQGTYTYMY